MEKSYFASIVKKYYLDGSTPTARWDIKDSSLNVNFKTADRSLLGVLSANIEMPDAQVGIYDTKNLLSFLGAFDENISVEYKSEKGNLVGIRFWDETVSGIHMLADLSVIEEVSGLKKSPDWDCEVTLNKNFIERLIRSKKSLSTSNIIAFMPSGIQSDQVEFIVNYSNHNTDRLSLTIPANITGYFDVSAYDGNMIIKVLSANMDFMEANLLISNQGIICFKFKNQDYEAEYYLQRIKM